MSMLPTYRRLARWSAIVWAALLVGCGSEQVAQAQSAAGSDARTEPSAAADVPSAAQLSAAFRNAANSALPAVVSIEVVTERRVAQGQPRIFRFFPDFPGIPQFPDEVDVIPQSGRGSGFIFDERGYILTNRHVVRGATDVSVRLQDGREYTATVVGSDPQTDVAVLQITPSRGERLPTVRLGDSDRLQVGDWVLALGNPLGLDFTVTAGIVSAQGRSIGILRRETETALEAFIQTDAAINPGNSGGPLINIKGEVIGINTAVNASAQGIGFAIPINTALEVKEALITDGRIRRAYMGVSLTDVKNLQERAKQILRINVDEGAVITQVEPDSPAAEAGLEVYDVITQIGDTPIKSAQDVTDDVAKRKPGEEVVVIVLRQGQRHLIPIVLGERPPGI